MKCSVLTILSLSLLLTVGASFSSAQVVTTNIDRSALHKTYSLKKTARTEAIIPLSLPFWDDFSWSNNIPSDSLWENSKHVEISAGNGISPPTYKVASFDGITLSGSSYDSLFLNDLESGDTDTLTSNPIDLSQLTTTEKNTVYFSFFYQKQGNGELPDNDDGLRVEFLSITATDTTWKTVIPPTTINGANVTDTDFHQIIIQVAGEEFFHDHFQFKIISTGRKTGAFDTWNIDYVYLNKGRNSTDTQYEDRSFTKTPSPPFLGFTALPIKHFLPIQNTLSTPIYSHFNALGPTQVFNFDLEAFISYQLPDSSKFQYVDKLDTANALISNQTTIEVVSDSITDFSKINSTATQATIKLKLFGDLQEDNIIDKPFNSLVNDTVYAEYYLKDYYAYDDGTAEKGAGVNSVGNEIAYQFPNLNATNTETNFLAGVDVYFPQAVGHDQIGEIIKIKVWSHKDGLPDEVLHNQRIAIRKAEQLNHFRRIQFFDTFIVPDTFYIGWEQLSGNRVYIGLDKNTIADDKIFYNTTNMWEANDGSIHGSLMMRPFFSDKLVTSFEKEVTTKKINIYPNPSSRFFKFDMEQSHAFSIFNLSGQEVHPKNRKEGTSIILDFESFPTGVYIIKFIDNNSIRMERLLLIN